MSVNQNYRFIQEINFFEFFTIISILKIICNFVKILKYFQDVIKIN